ncbi:hypothetical protein H6P81_000503 [Aristolochia fimbriata]|uniref:Uncharacterized protein n=1 Tax=Aristolochia fimbriata TaxID=158543 RepID=A0AAV7F6V0_ARIFI|nr:hypothetical protein H6P81_000503 [Aristolochia fimbriata]
MKFLFYAAVTLYREPAGRPSAGPSSAILRGVCELVQRLPAVFPLVYLLWHFLRIVCQKSYGMPFIGPPPISGPGQ